MLDLSKELTFDGQTKIACTAKSTFILNKGFLYSFGTNEAGTLGHSLAEEIMVTRPLKISRLNKQKIVGISTYSHHCLAWNDKGSIFSWGEAIFG